MKSPTGCHCPNRRKENDMNHDATHCADYKKTKCPKKCYRAQLTEELRGIPYPLPVSWAHFEGTKECPKPPKEGK